MKRIWAPWRLEYIKAEKSKGCFLCEKLKENKDEKNYILFRGKESFIVLNLYPYNNGHLMVAPYRHIGNLEDLKEVEMLDIMQNIKLSVKILKKAFNPDGFNIGLNIGAASGAGLVDHIHFHIVPRWHGDTNFMPVLADIKIIPQSLDLTYKELKKILSELQYPSLSL